MFDSSPWLPYRPKQRQISRTPAFNPSRSRWSQLSFGSCLNLIPPKGEEGDYAHHHIGISLPTFQLFHQAWLHWRMEIFQKMDLGRLRDCAYQSELGGRKTTNAASNGRCGVIVCTSVCSGLQPALLCHVQHWQYWFLCYLCTIGHSNFTENPLYIDFVSFFWCFCHANFESYPNISKYSLPNKRLRNCFFLFPLGFDWLTG